MRDDELVSLAGRESYFCALQELWPEVLDWLKVNVLPAFEPKWHSLEGERPVPILHEPWPELERGNERRTLVSALHEWAKKFFITETWIFETALDTLLAYYQCPNDRDGWFWRYQWRGFHPSFEPTFSRSVWYPPSGGWPESWADFKAHIESELKDQLSAYKRLVETHFGIGRDEIDRDARWTVLYQQGFDAIAINKWAELETYDDPEQAIFRAVERFARIIGLNLRRRKDRRMRIVKR